MKKNNTKGLAQTLRKSGLTLMCAVALCCGMTTSCFDDSEINGRLDNLEQRVSDLEESLTGQIDALKQLVDGRTAITSWKLDEETGIYEFVLSDGKTVSLAKGVDAASFIGVAQDESGAYYWTLGGEPLLNAANEKIYLESKVSPSVRVNPDTNEWEISPDGGKTYLQTGLKAGNSAYLITSVAEDDSYVYFTLSDGSQIQVKKEVDSSIAMLAGKQYFTAGQTKTINLQLEGVKKTAVFSKPDGWKASVAAETLSVTAPAADNANAETTGSVIVQAWFDDGTSDIAEVKVEVGEAPHEIAIDANYNITVSTSDAMAAEWFDPVAWDGGNYDGYALGAAKLSEFSEEWVKTYIEDNTRLEIHGPSEKEYTLEGLLGATPEKGESYVVWVVDRFYGEFAEDVYYSAITTMDIKIEATDITFEEATIKVSPKGVAWYYGGVFDTAENTIENILAEDINYGWATRLNKAYYGPLSQYATGGWGSNTLAPGKTYCAYAVPVIEGKSEYTIDDVYSVNVTIKPITSGGTAVVEVSDVEATMTTLSATVKKGAGTYKYFVEYLTENNIKDYADDAALLNKLVSSPSESENEYQFRLQNAAPDTKGWLVAVGVDKDGKAGTIVKKEANTLPITFNNITIPAPELTVGVKNVHVSIPATDGIKAYRYVNQSEIAWQNNYLYHGDESITENRMAIETNFYGVCKRVETTDGSLNIDLTCDTTGEPYVLFIIGEDVNQTPTRMIRANYTPSLDAGKFIRSTNEKYAEIAITNVTINDKPIAEVTKPGANDYQTYEFACQLNLPANCAKYWWVICEKSVINGATELLKASAMITYTNTEEFDNTKTVISKDTAYSKYRVRMHADYDLFIVWQDTDGNYYACKEYDIWGMAKSE